MADTQWHIDAICEEVHRNAEEDPSFRGLASLDPLKMCSLVLSAVREPIRTYEMVSGIAKLETQITLLPLQDSRPAWLRLHYAELFRLCRAAFLRLSIQQRRVLLLKWHDIEWFEIYCCVCIGTIATALDLPLEKFLDFMERLPLPDEEIAEVASIKVQSIRNLRGESLRAFRREIEKLTGDHAGLIVGNSIGLIRLRQFRKSMISSLFVVHLTEDQVSRYLEKRLTRMERFAVSEHFSICEQCRARVIRSTEVQRFASYGIFALTGVTRERKFSPLRFRRLSGAERLAIDMRNQLYPSALAREPRDEEIEPQRANRLDWAGSLWRRIFAGRTWGIATVAASAIALLVIVWFTRSQEDGVKLVTIRDSNKELKIGAHRFIGTSLFESAESRQINSEIARIGNDGKLTAPGAIRTLQDEDPRRLHGNTPANDSFKLQRPVRTAVDTSTPLIQWTSRSKATGYVVNVVVDDRNNRQVAKSGVIPASDNAASLYQWRLPENTPLGRGETYRWYVTAPVSDHGGHSAAVDEPAAKFFVLSGGESENLAGLKTKADGTQLVAGLLDLQAGLLDDAERTFDDLRQMENQTDEGKAFLEKVITEVKTLKGDR